MYQLLSFITAIGSIVTSISTIVLNILIIIAWTRMPRKLKQEMTNILLLNQASVNLLGTLPPVFWAYIILIHDKFSMALSKSLVVSFYYTDFAMMIALLLTTIEKFVVVRYPLYRNKISKKCKILSMLVVTWCIPVVPATASGLLYYKGNWKEFYDFVMVVIAILLLIVIVVLATLIFTFRLLRSLLRQQMIALSTLPLSQPQEHTVNIERQKDRRIIICMLCMVSAYALTILPDLIFNLLCFNARKLKIHYSACFWHAITFLIYTLYPTINPILNMFFRDDLKQARRWMTFQRDGQKENMIGGHEVGQDTLMPHDEDRYV